MVETLLNVEFNGCSASELQRRSIASGIRPSLKIDVLLFLGQTTKPVILPGKFESGGENDLDLLQLISEVILF
jgi:hypothetical protein